jgi:hypothetical protein
LRPGTRLVQEWRGVTHTALIHADGEFASTDPTTITQNAGFQESGFSPKISLNPRSRLQHFQRPTPSHLRKNAPSLQGHGDADVARRRRCGVSLTCQQICYVLYLVM